MMLIKDILMIYVVMVKNFNQIKIKQKSKIKKLMFSVYFLVIDN